MQRPIPEATFHIVLIGLVGYFLMESYSIRGSAAGGSLSPAFFPKAICVFLIVLLLLSLVRVIIEGVSSKDADEVRESSFRVSVIAWVTVLALLILYAFLLEPLGYVVTTALLIFCMVSTLVLLNKQEQKASLKGVAGLAGFSILTSLAIFILFSKGFSIILPTLGIAGV
ncbi:tripartite tricarboxylate transporter TctB family protein [Vreelandella songnenensis]|uniref:Tripartite tricarboxylate transporter TctB family protein n=1 Tax=Vreelandella songnenensis TaxID=1176243 RepID=A0A2T0V518_9GAMM|nr:tripartite tricarboxylate transporter TctB family protein [Halomonas songnenensis]PRY65266.1 tripartite tricarboxylate transporter TctB family protein [Halomonas songnenensis]